MQRLLLSLFFVVCSTVPETEICPRRHQALLLALLPLRRGENCSEWVQRGLQHKVALEAAVESVNIDSDLRIGLKILDTCSGNRTSKMAEEGVTFAESRCSKYPVFLGFLGPDDEGSLMTIHRELALKGYTHIVPGTITSFQLPVINLQVIDAKERARRISSFLIYLNWSSFVLLFTSDAISTSIAASILESEDFCLINSALRISAASQDITAIVKLRRTLQEVTEPRIVVIADDQNAIERIGGSEDDGWGDAQFVIYVQRSGIIPWRLSNDFFQKTTILHEVQWSPMVLANYTAILQNSTAWKAFLNQEGCETQSCRSSKVEIDPMVVPYVYSVHLIAAALRKTKCKMCGNHCVKPVCDDLKNIRPEEWKSIMQNTMTAATDSTTGKHYELRFHMKLEDGMNILRYSEREPYESVGTIGSEVNIFRSLKKSRRSRLQQCFVDAYDYELEPEAHLTDSVVQAKKDTERVIIERPNFGYYELLATVVGFPAALVLLLAITVLCVYKGLRQKGNESQISDAPSEYEVGSYS